MLTQSPEQELLEEFRQLNQDRQRRVLAYARSLRTRPPGLSGKLAVQYARELNWPRGDLDEIERAIEDAFEIIEDSPEVDLDE